MYIRKKKNKSDVVSIQIINKCAYIIIGLKPNGRKEVLGFG